MNGSVKRNKLEPFVSNIDVSNLDGIIAKLEKQLVLRRANAKAIQALSQSKFIIHTEKTRHLVNTIKSLEISKKMMLDY
jgi:hypothetical protein